MVDEISHPAITTMKPHVLLFCVWIDFYLQFVNDYTKLQQHNTFQLKKKQKKNIVMCENINPHTPMEITSNTIVHKNQNLQSNIRISLNQIKELNVAADGSVTIITKPNSESLIRPQSLQVGCENKVYRIILLGDRKVGKSSLIKSFATGEFSQTYISTPSLSPEGDDIQPVEQVLITTTTEGVVRLDIFEYAFESTNMTGTRMRFEKNKLKFDGAIVMKSASYTDRYSDQKMYQYINLVKSYNNNTKIVICESMIDQELENDPLCTINSIKPVFTDKSSGYKKVYTSSKLHINQDIPFLLVVRQINKDVTFMFDSNRKSIKSI